MIFQSTLPVGGATSADVGVCELNKFQSTLPVGGATIELIGIDSSSKISIHAPRGGSDIYRLRSKGEAGYFNPRSPWGERRINQGNYS